MMLAQYVLSIGTCEGRGAKTYNLGGICLQCIVLHGSNGTDCKMLLEEASRAV